MNKPDLIAVLSVKNMADKNAMEVEKNSTGDFPLTVRKRIKP
jgi:hypothetical protein